jgi:hypothetical protein
MSLVNRRSAVTIDAAWRLTQARTRKAKHATVDENGASRSVRRQRIGVGSRMSAVVSNGRYFLERRFAFAVESPDVAIITSVDLMIAIASSPRRSFSARTASAVMTAVSD